LDKLIIVGIDPGITKGYAVLDINGNILEVKSSKKFTRDIISKEIFKFGKPILIGTDVNKIPSFVGKIASVFGARIFKPKINLQSHHKLKLVKKFLKDKDIEIKSKHENDALISAILAYKSIKQLLNKIENKYPNLNVEEIKNLVLKENINIKEAINLVND
jgi:predicted RNase H-like nuclease (RuvC/YqgF family)